MTRRKNALEAFASKALIYNEFLAPRPGLEPGTYGLTVPSSNRIEVSGRRLKAT
ncbi:hypothetical protein RA210_U10582 [Rubrivivax sp. A210]|nr:hypothetical protein RA210_U10582 [Rubrivivax sp. A210]